MPWYNAIVYVTVIYIVALSVAEALSGAPFDPLAVAGSAFMLLALPVLHKLASRRPKERRK